MAQTGFGSDNFSGVHKEIMDALAEANHGHEAAYGYDQHTESAIKVFKKHFTEDIDVFFVFNGTAANVLCLKAATDNYHAVICADTAHINVDECGAPERFTGCKLLVAASKDGKIGIEDIKVHMHGFGFEHHAQPKVISITQPTELGAVYRLEEIRAIVEYAHEHGLFVHMDGARLSQAAVFLNTGLGEITAGTGIDMLSFGGTKNGMMYGEAVVFFNRDLARNFKYIRKQAMQLGSKMRFVAAQFNALLSGNLWHRSAAHAHKMARILAEGVNSIESVRVTCPVESNAVFAVLPAHCIPILQEEFFFYVWNETDSEVRWVTSFDTGKRDIEDFIEKIKKVTQSR
ncbi:low specificity L-threonine aldolase [Desulfobacterales bacterium HSG16]|nr:low specificity L-threonine aldolase [Desulfobacterales bacterium HSG16]